jgi:hypothetical protein
LTPVNQLINIASLDYLGNPDTFHFACIEQIFNFWLFKFQLKKDIETINERGFAMVSDSRCAFGVE